MAEKQFCEGLFYKQPGPKAPPFIKANLSFNVIKFVEWLQKQTNERGWVNVDIKESREGKIYAELNNWQPKKEVQTIQQGQSFDEQMNAPAQEPTKIDDDNSIDIKDIPFA